MKVDKWFSLAEFIAEGEKINSSSRFYTDEFIASQFDTQPHSPLYNFQWMKCREYLLKNYGVDFIRVKHPVKGYRAMTDAEKATFGFQRRMRKTKRNIKRLNHCIHSVKRNALCESDQKAFDINTNRLGLLESVVQGLPRGVKNLRVVLEINNDMPGLK